MDIYRELDAAGPQGAAGLVRWQGNVLLPYREVPALDAVLAYRVAAHPWFIVLWQPLTGPVGGPGAVPGPPAAQAYCCYLNTVIFYALDAFGHYVVDDTTKTFREHGRVEHVFYGEDVLDWRGPFADRVVEPERFTLAGGRCVWWAAAGVPGRWWMRHVARRIHPDDAALREHVAAALRKRLKVTA